MASNRDASTGRLFTCVASVVTVVVIASLACWFYARWVEIKPAPVLETVSALGGVGTFLALIWLICGHFRQAAQFRAQINSAYQGSLQPIIVFRNTGEGDWLMLNAGKGTAINVEVYGGNEEEGWKLDDSVRFSAIRVEGKICLAFLSRQRKLLAQYSDPFGRMFTSKCQDSKNSCKEGHEYPGFEAKHGEWEIDPKTKKLRKQSQDSASAGRC